MFLWLILGGLAIAAAGSRGTRIGGRATKPGVITTKLELGKQPGDKWGLQVQPISVANGWQPVWIEAAQNKWLEWGACYYQWQQDIMLHDVSDENAAAKRMANALAKTMNYVLDLAAVIKWLLNRVCFRVYVPATKIKVNGEWYFVPQSPRYQGFEKHQRMTGGAWALPGWNPGTSRFGFATTFPEWPLEWPPPAGKLTGGWMRNLGDITGTGYDTWQLVSLQDGSERSFPMMSEKGWRAVFGFSEHKWPGHSNSDPLSMFHVWRGQGAEGVKKTSATKTKATNRYQVPA